MHALLAIAVVLSVDPPPPPPLTQSGGGFEPSPYPAAVAPAEPEPIPGSFSIYVSFLEPSFAVLSPGTSSGSPVAGTSASATFRLGAVLGARHAILVGLSFAAFGSLGSSSGSSLGLTLAPAYRIHFKPLVPGGLSPFLQIEGLLGTVLIANSGTSTPILLGFGPGLGAEYLFSRNFGIAAAIGGRLSFLSILGSSFVGVSLWSSVAVALHF